MIELPVDVDISLESTTQEHDVSIVLLDEEVSLENSEDFPIEVDVSFESTVQEYNVSIVSLDEAVDLENSTAINVIYYDAPLYEGEYDVVPLAASEVVLPTKNKLCTDDITVNKIPRHETSNDYGTTFYIAEV